MEPQHKERRLTTILAADVVGYSGLMAADEAGTFARLKVDRKELIEPKTAEYHGRVVKLTGDGTLMEFGSVVDAVHFAVDVQRAMVERDAAIPEDCRIRYRVGINIGDTIVDGEDIYGDGVNVAVRLEEIPRRWYGGMVSTNLEVIWEISVNNRPEIGVRNILSIVAKRNQSSLLETQHLHSLDLTPCISILMQNPRTQSVPGLSASYSIQIPHSFLIRAKWVRKALAWTI